MASRGRKGSKRKAGQPRGTARPRAAAPKFPAITKRVEDLGGGKSRTVYRLRIPKALRDLAPKEQVRKLADLVAKKHGTGARDYKKLHFLFTFTGTEYSPYTKKKIGRGIYGTGAKASLTDARREIESRIKAVKEGSTAGGSPKLPAVKAAGYGVFRNGPFEIDAIVMESKAGKLTPHKKTAGKPHGKGQTHRGTAIRKKRRAAAIKGWKTRRANEAKRSRKRRR